MAERLFAERGYDATSLRAVTGEAEVNLAAVHYHFGGKQKLFQAVFERRVAAINRERIDRLDELEASSGVEAPPLDEVLRAFLGPPLRRLRHPDDGERRILQIIGRLQSSTGEHAQALRDVFRGVQERFFPAFHRALPHLSQEDLFWRFHFLIGAMCSFLADPVRIQLLSGGVCDTEEAEPALAHLLAFASGGLRGASVGRRDSSASGAAPERPAGREARP